MSKAYHKRTLRALAASREAYRLSEHEKAVAARHGASNALPYPAVAEVLRTYTFRPVEALRPGTLAMAVERDSVAFVVTYDAAAGTERWQATTPRGYEHWTNTIVCAVMARVAANRETRSA